MLWRRASSRACRGTSPARSGTLKSATGASRCTLPRATDSFFSHASCRSLGYYSDDADAARRVDAAYAERGHPSRNVALLAQPRAAAEATAGGAAAAAAAAASPPRQPDASAAAAAPQSKAPSSAYSGVSWNKRDKKWNATIRHAGKQTCVSSSHRFFLFSFLLQLHRFLQRRDGRGPGGGTGIH
jgi:hypothetical protein